MKPISIHYIAEVTGIPQRTISLNVKALLDNLPDLRKKMEKNDS